MMFVTQLDESPRKLDWRAHQENWKLTQVSMESCFSVSPKMRFGCFRRSPQQNGNQGDQSHQCDPDSDRQNLHACGRTCRSHGDLIIAAQ